MSYAEKFDPADFETLETMQAARRRNQEAARAFRSARRMVQDAAAREVKARQIVGKPPLSERQRSLKLVCRRGEWKLAFPEPIAA